MARYVTDVNVTGKGSPATSGGTVTANMRIDIDTAVITNQAKFKKCLDEALQHILMQSGL